MNRMAVLSGSVPVRFGSRFLPVPRFMLARGRGGAQVLEHLGPESAENLYSPARPWQCRGNTEHVLSLYGGKKAYIRYWCWAADAGEYRFWNIWDLKVLKTCTPPRAPAMQGNTEHVLSLYGAKETYFRYFFREAMSRVVGGAGPRARGSTGFGTFGA